MKPVPCTWCPVSCPMVFPLYSSILITVKGKRTAKFKSVSLEQRCPNYGLPYTFIQTKNKINKCFKKLNKKPVSFYETVYILKTAISPLLVTENKSED
jgi:hypothetical protein